MHCWGICLIFSLQLILCGMRRGFCFVWKVLLRLGARLLLDRAWVRFLAGWWCADFELLFRLHWVWQFELFLFLFLFLFFLQQMALCPSEPPLCLWHLLARSWTSVPHHWWSHYCYYLTSQNPPNRCALQPYKHLLRFHLCLIVLCNSVLSRRDLAGICRESVAWGRWEEQEQTAAGQTHSVPSGPSQPCFDPG